MRGHSSPWRDPRLDLSEAIRDIGKLADVENANLTPLVMEVLFSSGVHGRKTPQEAELRADIADLMERRKTQRLSFLKITDSLDEKNEEEARGLVGKVRAFERDTRKYITALGQLAYDLTPDHRADLRFDLDRILSSEQAAPSGRISLRAGEGDNVWLRNVGEFYVRSDELFKEEAFLLGLEKRSLKPLVAKVLKAAEASGPLSERQDLLRSDIRDAMRERTGARAQILERIGLLDTEKDEDARLFLLYMKRENDALRKHIVAVAQLAYDMAPGIRPDLRRALDKVADEAQIPARPRRLRGAGFGFEPG
ncbi:MAG: hypothetical protein PHE27_02090 [Alphaproteobacteria bacterium]|nr:hypothetical protein [Alphaproteobacteria bacterium]